MRNPYPEQIIEMVSEYIKANPETPLADLPDAVASHYDLDPPDVNDTIMFYLQERDA